MDRRSFLRGVVAAPIVITTPGLLMPVKALPKPFAYVWGVWLNGEKFTKEIWDVRPASFVAAEPWFDDVAGITNWEYTDLNPETNPYITPPSVFSAFNREVGRPMLSPMERTPDANGDKIVNLCLNWHKDPTQYLLDKAIR